MVLIAVFVTVLSLVATEYLSNKATYAPGRVPRLGYNLASFATATIALIGIVYIVCATMYSLM